MQYSIIQKKIFKPCAKKIKNCPVQVDPDTEKMAEQFQKAHGTYVCHVTKYHYIKQRFWINKTGYSICVICVSDCINTHSEKPRSFIQRPKT